MPFIWNDKTYWKRFKESSKTQGKFFVPLFIMSFIMWRIFLDDDIHLVKLVFASLMSASVIYTFVSMFLEFPNERIPDTYSPMAKKILHIINFLIACFGLYIVLVKIVFVNS